MIPERTPRDLRAEAIRRRVNQVHRRPLGVPVDPIDFARAAAVFDRIGTPSDEELRRALAAPLAASPPDPNPTPAVEAEMHAVFASIAHDHALPPVTTFTFQWADLVSENARYGPDPRQTVNGKAKIGTTKRYRHAKTALHDEATSQAGLRGLPIPDPAVRWRLEGLVYFPKRPERQLPDVTAYGKIVQDALEDVVYVDDRQVRDARWREGGQADPAPRVVVTLTPLPPLTLLP